MMRGGTNPIVTVLDCGKAFDKCKFSLLFRCLLDKGLPAVIFITPTRCAMQRMLVEIEAFAAEFNITFSTDPVASKSKTKCLYIVGNRRHLRKPAPLILCGRELPYVRQAEHLGNMLTEEGNMEQDIVIKRARFIQSSVEIRSLFSFAAPAEVLHALKVYSRSFYGSCMWDLGCMKAKQVYSAWNTVVKPKPRIIK